MTTHRAPINVLIVDDVPMIRESMAIMLSLHNTIGTITFASDGDEAIAAVAEQLPDVIVMDIRMPRVDGITAAREIRARFPQVGIVVHSAYEDPSLRAQASDAGIDSYFLKGSPVREFYGHVSAAAAASRERVDALAA